MKLLQYAVCAFSLAVTAAAQTAPPAAPPSAPAAKPMTLSTLGGDDAKGPANPITLDQMKTLYVDMGYDKLLEENRVGMLAQQKQRAPFIPQDVWDDFDATSKKVDYPAAILPVYQKYLSTEDAAKLIDFAKTEAGKAFLSNLPAITGATAQAVQKQGQSVGAEVQGRHKDEIEAAVKKYREENQPKPPPSLAPGAPPSPSAPAAPATPPAPATPKN